jgi:hypothetical protein
MLGEPYCSHANGIRVRVVYKIGANTSREQKLAHISARLQVGAKLKINTKSQVFK